MTGKRINEVKLSIEDELFLELNRMAVIQDRKLADLVHHILGNYVYGHRPANVCEMEVRIREKYGL